MRKRVGEVPLLFLVGAVALGLVAFAWAIEAGSSEAQQGVLHNCPQAGKWALAVWDGADGTDAEQAFATCEGVSVAAAYSIDPGTQQWSRWFAGRPEPDMSNLRTLDNMQGVMALGSLGAPTPSVPGLSLFWGDLHGHTSYSDAEGLPSEYFAKCRENGVDFCALTDHAEQLNAAEWEDIQEQADASLEEGAFVSFAGFEWSSLVYGHKVAYFPDRIPGPCKNNDPECDSPEKLYQFLAENDGLSHAAHPCGAPPAGTDWTRFDATYQPNMEYCGDDRPFALGYRVGLLDASDTHTVNPGGGNLTACWAESLTRKGILDALRNRRCYAVYTLGGPGSFRPTVDFTVDGQPMGSEFSRPANSEVTATVSVTGQVQVEDVELVMNGVVIGASDCEGGCTYSLAISVSEDSYVYPRLLARSAPDQPLQQLAWVSPVWVNVE
ncbi:MAG: CehA/McbA family metallohydrolase [Dehalococcoidia bacterium]|nr:CehA/McbA family metallohydrolase [Dehalococcoidia bacterium]